LPLTDVVLSRLFPRRKFLKILFGSFSGQKYRIKVYWQCYLELFYHLNG